MAVKTGDLIDYLGDKLGVPAAIRTTAAERSFLIEQQREMMRQDQAMMAMAGQQQQVANNQMAGMAPDQAEAPPMGPA